MKSVIICLLKISAKSPTDSHPKYIHVTQYIDGYGYNQSTKNLARNKNHPY